MKKSGIIFATIALLASFGVAPAVFADGTGQGTGQISATVEDSDVAPTVSGTANYKFSTFKYSWTGGEATLPDQTVAADSNLTVRSLSKTDGYKLAATVTGLPTSATVKISDQNLTLKPYSETSVTPSQATLHLPNGANTDITGTITYTIQAQVAE